MISKRLLQLKPSYLYFRPKKRKHGVYQKTHFPEICSRLYFSLDMNCETFLCLASKEAQKYNVLTRHTVIWKKKTKKIELLLVWKYWILWTNQHLLAACSITCCVGTKQGIQVVFVVHLVVSDSLQPHGLQHARLCCPSLSPRVCSNSYRLGVGKSWTRLSDWTVSNMSVVSLMPSNHLTLCHPLLLLPSILPGIRILSSELALHIRWPGEDSKERVHVEERWGIGVYCMGCSYIWFRSLMS